jgi:hypothetical protein
MNGVRQGDSLSPILFNLMMDKVITNLPKELGYRMGNNPINIICSADDAVLIADSKENLQALLLKFDQMAASLNMEISLNKTKSLVISRNNIKYWVKLRDTVIEQVPKFSYLGAEISAKRDLKQEVRTQAARAAGISGCLYNLIWLNKYMSTTSKVRIYKTNVRPVLKYGQKRLRDKIRSEQFRQLSGTQDIIKWTNVRRKEWDDHVDENG